MAMPTKKEQRMMNSLLRLKLKEIFAPGRGMAWPVITIPQQLSDKWWQESRRAGLSAYTTFMAKCWEYVNQQRLRWYKQTTGREWSSDEE